MLCRRGRVGVAMGVLALAAAAEAQPEGRPAAAGGPGQGGQAAPTPAATSAATTRLLSDAIARLATFDLRSAVRPTDTDYRVAALLLGMAHELQPQNQDLLRRQLEAAWGAGDHDLVLEITRKILAIDPRDTVAQLRLITANIASGNQTAEERLAAYERFIGDRRFGDPIRSRLALDAALLLRERGDMEGFVEKLTQATSLDSTHKEAAALAATYFAERRPEDRVERLTLLQNLLMADPVDPNVHMTIARELVVGGAYRGALRAFRTAISIMQASGTQIDEDISLQMRVLQWHTEGPAVVARDIRTSLMHERGAVARQLQRFRGEIPRGAPMPEDVRLPLSVAITAVIAAKASNDLDGVRDAYNEFLNTLRHSVEMLEDPEQRAKLGEERAAQASAELFLQLVMVRVLADVQAETVQEDMGKNEGLRPFFPDQFAVLESWAKLRSGADAAEVAAELRPHAEDNLLARLGLGMALEKMGRAQESVQHYQQLLRTAPLSTFGAWARTLLEAQGVRHNPAGVAALERAAAKIPDWIDRMISHPHEFVQVIVTNVNKSPEIIDAAPLRITIQNLAQVPLALGADRAINSRFVLSPKLENQDHVLNPWVRPEIVDVDRRLRLMPRERLEVEVNPDYGYMGWLMESLAMRSLRLRWRATQGFIFDQTIGFRPGVMCLVADTDAVQRLPLREASLPIEGMLQLVANGLPSDVPRVAAVIRAAIMQPVLIGEGPGDEEQRRQLADARAQLFGQVANLFAARYPSLSPRERAAVVALLPHASIEPGMAAFDQAIRAEEDPLPLALILATRVRNPEDELLVKAGGSPDPRTRQLAFLIAERLGAGERLYATIDRERLQQRRQDRRVEEPR